MKPLHSQRIKQGQRILLISEKQKEGGGVQRLKGVLGGSSDTFCATLATKGEKGGWGYRQKTKTLKNKWAYATLTDNPSLDCCEKTKFTQTVPFEV